MRTAWKETKSKPKEIKDFFFDFQLKIAVTGRCDYCKVFNQFLCLGPGLGRGRRHYAIVVRVNNRNQRSIQSERRNLAKPMQRTG